MTFTLGLNWPKRDDDREIITIMKKTVAQRLEGMNPRSRNDLVIHLEPYDVNVYGKDPTAIKEATKLLKKKA